MRELKPRYKNLTARSYLRCACAVSVSFLMGLTLLPQPARANAQYQKDYINAVLPWAQQAHATYGVPVSVAIAQSVKETGWYLPKASNNLFNVKALGSDPYMTGATSSGWRAYGSGSGAFLGYGYFSTHDPNFTGGGGAHIDCRPDLNNPLQFLHDLAFDGFEGGYGASDSEKQAYYDDVVGIINFNDLTQYDQPGSSGFDPANPYVDAGYSGTQVGTAAQPFKTVAQAVNAASTTQSATIHIKPGVYPEKMTIHKNILLVTWGNGTVRIGG